MFGWLKNLFVDKEAEARRQEQLRMMAAVEEIAAGVARALVDERRGVDPKLTVRDVKRRIMCSIRSKKTEGGTKEDGAGGGGSSFAKATEDKTPPLPSGDVRYQRREVPSGESRYSLSDDIRYSKSLEPLPCEGATRLPGSGVVDFSQVKKEKTFAQRLNELVNAHCGGVPSDCYRRAGVQRQTYSKIISTGGRSVSKRIALQLCVGAKAGIHEAIELLESAGYAFSKASYEDAVFRWCLENGVYSMMYVNELLVHCNCKPCELVW